MSSRKPIGVLDGEQLLLRESFRRLVEIETGDLLFSEISCRLQESDIESGEAVVVPGNP